MGCRVKAVATPNTLLLAGVRVSSVGKVRELREMFFWKLFSHLTEGDKGGSLEKESSSLAAPSPWFT